MDFWKGPMPDSLGRKIKAGLIKDSAVRRNLIASFRVARDAGCVTDISDIEQTQLRIADGDDDMLRKLEAIEKKTKPD